MKDVKKTYKLPVVSLCMSDEEGVDSLAAKLLAELESELGHSVEIRVYQPFDGNGLYTNELECSGRQVWSHGLLKERKVTVAAADDVPQEYAEVAQILVGEYDSCSTFIGEHSSLFYARDYKAPDGFDVLQRLQEHYRDDSIDVHLPELDIVRKGHSSLSIDQISWRLKVQGDGVYIVGCASGSADAGFDIGDIDDDQIYKHCVAVIKYDLP